MLQDFKFINNDIKIILVIHIMTSSLLIMISIIILVIQDFKFINNDINYYSSVLNSLI